TRRGCVPLLVGGTMLYFKALRDGLAKLPEADQQIREDILNLARAEGWGAVHKALQAVDPAAAARIQPGDQQRLQRALEVYRLTGQPLSELQKSNGNPCPYRLIQIGLLPEDRGLLHRRIEERLRTMLADGFVDEVRRLYERGDLHPNLPSIKSAGYRQIWSYLAGEIDQETMFQQVLAATRQLAKRQITWMRSWKVLEIIPCLPYPDRAQALKLLRSAII
ncbi:MAG: tRNA (adenosine(37)-N6)-dimethylallyltransferase MiaA, partial [Gammaproteobacteria bacterium]|nr:tRNA (adenosine(37)-N6)-dimethylallyltransferase MiaA [Gammaproteobacteria bacterium]